MNTTMNTNASATSAAAIKQFNMNLKFILIEPETTKSFKRLLDCYGFIANEFHPKFDAIKLHQLQSGKCIFLVHDKTDQANYDWSGFIYLKDKHLRLNYGAFKTLRGFTYSYTYEYDYARFSLTRKELCDLANISHEMDEDNDEIFDDLF